MGYTTDFTGRFTLNKPLDDDTYTFLDKFNRSRRMARNRGPEYGVEGEFYVDGADQDTEYRAPDIIDHNTPPRTQPGLWCKWMPSDDRLGIEWDEGEKFYSYTEWLAYLIKQILAPRGYVLSGQVEWQGEEPDNFGVITVEKNQILVQKGQRQLAPPEPFDWQGE